MRVVGNRVTLREITREDMANKVRWFNDPEVNKTLLLEENLDLEKTLDWFDRHKQDSSRHDFVIESKEGEPIGITGLLHIDPVHRTAECFCIIGEKACWGKGLGTEIHAVLIDWGFRQLGLHKIWADIRAENAAIIKVIERLGFKIEGTLREEKLIRGKRIDVVRIGLLRDDFYQANPELSKPSK